MTIIPSIEYLELTAFNPFHNTYVNRDEHFGGYIIYHNLDGTFANGWKYVDGKITHTVSESIVPVDSIKNSPSVQTRMHEECEEFVYEVLVNGALKQNGVPHAKLTIVITIRKSATHGKNAIG